MRASVSGKSWRSAYFRYTIAAGRAVAWLDAGDFPEDVPEPPELTELDDAYQAVIDRIPRRHVVARYALEDFHDAFGKTLEKIQRFEVGVEFLELRLLRLDQLHEQLVPHALVLPTRLKYQLAGTTVIAVATYALFPESLRHDMSSGSDALYLAVIGTMLLLFTGLVAAVVLRGIRSPARGIGVEGVFLLMPSLLNLVLMFAWSYWARSDSSRSCLDEAADKVDALYFSLATFTTTGFGDLVPWTGLCRGLVTMQMASTFVVVSALLTVYLGGFATSRR